MVCGAGMDRAVPKMFVFKGRGVTLSPTIFHSVPSLMITCGPRWLLAMIAGVIKPKVALKGSGGNSTRPVTCPGSDPRR